MRNNMEKVLERDAKLTDLEDKSGARRALSHPSSIHSFIHSRTRCTV